MGLPAYSISFGYIQSSGCELDEAQQLLNALDCLKELSSEIEANFDPKFSDPLVVKNNKKLVDRLIDDNRIGARIKRWWSKTDPQVEPSEVVEALVNSHSNVLMRDFDSAEEWATLAVAALAVVADDSFPRVCIYVWGRRWKTTSLWLYLDRNEKGAMVIEGLLMSIDAYENQDLRLPMKDCISKLKRTGKFEEH